MKKIIACFGHSHTKAIRSAYDRIAEGDFPYDVKFVNLRLMESPSLEGGCISEMPDLLVLSINGNQHNLLGMVREKSIPVGELVEYFEKLERRLWKVVVNDAEKWLHRLVVGVNCPVLLVLPPPPVCDEAHILNNPGVFSDRLKTSIFNPPEKRLEFWQIQCKALREVSQKFGIPTLDTPSEVLSEKGLLDSSYCGQDPTHANARYGHLVLQQIFNFSDNFFEKDKSPIDVKEKVSHPYTNLPDYCFWRQSISDAKVLEVDPVVNPKFIITKNQKVATAGSCFAQHISRKLQSHGFHYMQMESSIVGSEDSKLRGYNDFSARYGNVYTSRQLLQLFDRAFGYFNPNEQAWVRPGGGWCDPFRPRIEPAGFESIDAIKYDQSSHFAAVREMFKTLDVFVFTLGLTECWLSRVDGSAFPLAPGVAGGEFDVEKYEFKNFTVSEVASDLRLFLKKLKFINPSARLLLTVSPVPLVATAEKQHVLVATTYSKAVLRVAAEEVSREHEDVYYFPSYEIITGAHSPHGYYEENRREVAEAGVSHVMRVFMSRMTDFQISEEHTQIESNEIDRALDEADLEMSKLGQLACDEEMLAR